jgi:uncharacterized protein (TIGR03000 family)
MKQHPLWLERFLAALTGVLVAAGISSADGTEAKMWTGPHATTAAFPTVNPPGWYTNTYWYNWYYPWYAYYNWSQGPYANWAASGGFATYGYRVPAPPGPVPALVTIHLPADAQLLFSGVAAAGSGEIRTFMTPPLEPNQEYGYEMTVEVRKDGRIFGLTKTVIILANDRKEIRFNADELKELKLPPVEKKK